MATVGNETKQLVPLQQLMAELKSIPVIAETASCAQMIQPVMYGFMASLLSLITLLVIISAMNNRWSRRALGEQRQ